MSAALDRYDSKSNGDVRINEDNGFLTRFDRSFVPREAEQVGTLSNGCSLFDDGLGGS